MSQEQHAFARFAAEGGVLDASKGIALYVQLSDIFRYQILSGRWPDGRRLDNFDVLAARYKVARITVRQAVARLVQDGLLTSQRGRGTFVTVPAPDRPRGRRIGVSTFPHDLRIEVIEQRPVPSLPEEFRTGYEAFDRYVEVSKVHHVQDEPFGMMRIFVAEEIFKRFPRRAIEKLKILRLVFEHGGTSVEQMRQRMTVEPADTILSARLNYPVGSPVAKILRQIHGEDRRLAYAGVSWYRGDTFEMDITLPRALVEDSSPALIAPSVRAAHRRS